MANAPGGLKVVSTSLVPGGSQHAARVQLARALLESHTPLGPKPLGPSSPAWVFLSQVEVVTGQQRSSLYGAHLLLTGATALNATHARLTAAAYPSDAFVKFEFSVQPSNGAARTLTSSTPSVTIGGLTPATTVSPGCALHRGLRAALRVGKQQLQGPASPCPSDVARTSVLRNNCHVSACLSVPCCRHRMPGCHNPGQASNWP